MEEAEFLCHRIAFMDRGKIVAMDSPSNLVKALPLPYEVRIKSSNGYDMDGLRGLAGVKELELGEDGAVKMRSTDASATLPALMDWSSKTGAPLSHLEVIPANLEDVFLSLTGHELRD